MGSTYGKKARPNQGAQQHERHEAPGVFVRHPDEIRSGVSRE